VTEIVLELLKSASKRENMQLSSKITDKELDRELANFMNIVDANGDHQISYEELENAMFTMMSGEEEGDNNDAKTLRGIVYFPNLMEYTSSHVVYEITGLAVTSMEDFGSLLKWPNPDGVNVFWDKFVKHCGVTLSETKQNVHLNGQDVRGVQRKLVRVLENYAFTKFCWNSIVRPLCQKSESSVCVRATKPNPSPSLTPHPAAGAGCWTRTRRRRTRRARSRLWRCRCSSQA
jgi:hypothetical protein